MGTVGPFSMGQGRATSVVWLGSWGCVPVDLGGALEGVSVSRLDAVWGISMVLSFEVEVYGFEGHISLATKLLLYLRIVLVESARQVLH